MKIVVDERETKLYEAFHGFATSVSKCVLPIGDIIITTDEGIELCIIERKTLQDLLASIKDGRYVEQSFRLTHASGHHPHNIIYLIEGMFSTIHSEKEKTMIYSALTSLNYFKGFSVIRTMHIQETAEFLVHMTEKISKNYKKNITPNWNTVTTEIKEIQNVATNKEETNTRSIERFSDPPKEKEEDNYVRVIKKVKKENVTIQNISEIMLCQIPNVSTVISSVIVQKYQSLQNLIGNLEKDENCLCNLTYELKGKSRKISCAAISNVKKYLLLQHEDIKLSNV